MNNSPGLFSKGKQVTHSGKGPSGGFNKTEMDTCVAGTALRWTQETWAHV